MLQFHFLGTDCQVSISSHKSVPCSFPKNPLYPRRWLVLPQRVHRTSLGPLSLLLTQQQFSSQTSISFSRSHRQLPTAGAPAQWPQQLGGLGQAASCVGGTWAVTCCLPGHGKNWTLLPGVGVEGTPPQCTLLAPAAHPVPAGCDSPPAARFPLSSGFCSQRHWVHLAYSLCAVWGAVLLLEVAGGPTVSLSCLPLRSPCDPVRWPAGDPR